MARRRAKKWQRALAGAAEGVQPILGYLLQMQRQEQFQQDYLDRLAESDRLTTARQSQLAEEAAERSLVQDLEESVMKGSDPGLAEARMPGRRFRHLEPSPQARVVPISEDIQKAASLAALPTKTGLRRRLEGARVSPEMYWQDPNLQPLMVGRPETPEGEAESPFLQSFLQETEEKREALQAGVPFQSVESTDPRTGVGRREYIQQNKLGELGPLQTERTGRQEGERQLEASLAHELSPAYATAKAHAENTLAKLTRGEKVETERQMEKARAETGLEVSASPRALETLTARAKATAKGQAPTEAETRAQAAVIRLTDAHGKMLALEAQGVELPAVRSSLATLPLIGGVAGPAVRGTYSDLEQQYDQSVGTFLDFYAYTLSGVTVRQDERPNYMRTITILSTDKPGVKTAKQQARAGIFASAITGAREGAYEAGRVLARGIQDRTIPAAVLSTLTIENPEFDRGITETLGSERPVDANGYLILTGPAGAR